MSISFIYNISFVIVCLLLEQRDVYMIISFIYILYIIYNRMALYCLREKKGGGGSIHEYIIHISYILYHRLFVHCLKNVYMNIYFIYTSYIIILWFIIVCQSIAWRGKKGVYTWVYPLYLVYHLSSFVASKKNIYISIPVSLPKVQVAGYS